MTYLAIALVLAILIGSAFMLSRAHYARALVDRGEVADPEAMPFVVTVDPDSGKLKPVVTGLDAMRAEWHPIRFPLNWDSRAAGLPAEKATYDLNFRARRKWCEQHCRRQWRMENPTSPARVFWFEDHRDAMAFSLEWYPFKCG